MAKHAILFRMQTDEHICPFGLRAKDLLRRQGYQVDDRVLSTREQTDKIKAKLDVKTTPHVIIDGERIGGFDDLQAYFNKTTVGTKVEDETSYFPVIALFTIAALLSAGISYQSSWFSFQGAVIQFIGISMVMLGLLKLQNVESFVNGFLGYDLLAKRYVPYAFVYPYAEVIAGLLMVSSLLPFISIPLMIFIGGIGGISVIKAVYIDKRELKCACVGGDSNVPLGFVSFLENAVMFIGGVWMLISHVFI